MPRRDDPQRGLGKAIRRFRTEARLSQEALGERAEIHPTWISHIESGRINPTWGNVRRIAYGLGVPLSRLAGLAEKYERELDES
jgi:transcriptional regulator with XRE-family HTH domain